jgi:DNA-binding phage protein
MAKRKSKATVSRYDSADYLKTEEEMGAYLEACLEQAPDDASYLAAALAPQRVYDPTRGQCVRKQLCQ